MKAMVLAAGFGTRLKEYTATTPKCLVPVAGIPILEHVLRRLERAGVKEAVINLHYLPEQVRSFIAKRSSPLKIQFSEEGTLLGTGGGLNNARQFFKNEAAFFMVNADIYCDLELEKLWKLHNESERIATLLTMERTDSSYLAFDKDGLLQGWKTSNKEELVCQGKVHRYLAFCGIQCLSRKLFDYMEEAEGSFSIIESYMKAARAGERILSYELQKNYLWSDIGTLDSLKALEQQLKSVAT